MFQHKSHLVSFERTQRINHVGVVLHIGAENAQLRPCSHEALQAEQEEV